MTLLLAAHVGTRILLATDSFLGMQGAEPKVETPKVEQWNQHILLTAIGDLSPPPVGMAVHPALRVDMSAPSAFDHRASLVHGVLNQSVRAKPPTLAACLLFGFDHVMQQRSPRPVTDMAPGIVVIDTTFLKHLLVPSTVMRLQAQLRLTNLELVPSIANVIEALKHTKMGIREALLSGIQGWSGGQPLNPWPLDLLRLAGRALQEGRIAFHVDDDSLNSVRVRHEALEEDHHRAVQFLKTLEDSFTEPYKRNRESFQRQLKREGRRGAWPDLPSFLPRVSQ